MEDSSAPVLKASTRPIRWVFLDRDGTLNVKAPDGEYVCRPDALELLPGAAEAVASLNRAGMWTGVVTNQRGIALGQMSTEDLEAVHERLRYLLALEGASVDSIYTCPHQIGECDCRKPEPGLLWQARAEHPSLDFTQAAIVGDSASDVEAGRRLGLRTFLISGAADERSRPREGADHHVADLAEAARLLLEPS